jgi:septum formation protein
VNIILGSASPRRKSILEGIFGDLQIISPSVDESILENEIPEDYTMRITNLKMDAVLSLSYAGEGSCVVTSDTIVSIDGKILGKPESESEASSMLKMLSGREHYVLTGLSVVFNVSGELKRVYDCEKTFVKFKILDSDTIRNYLNTVNYRDKAGSYAIQEHGEMIVDSVNGSVTNVIGLPLRLFFKIINGIGGFEDILYHS